MELLFEDQRMHQVLLPSVMPNGKPMNISYLIHWIRDNLLKGNVDLFMEGNTVLAEPQLKSPAVSSNRILQASRHTGIGQ